MKKLLLWLALLPAVWAQGTTPTTGAWTKISVATLNSVGYPVWVIAQFDKADWDFSRHCYLLWGQYKAATFSEVNEAMGCYSYAENFPHMIEQVSSTHSTNRPATGHQWGDTAYDSNHGIYYWTDQPTNASMDPWWRMRAFDTAGMVDRDLPLFSISGTLSRPWYGGATTLSGYMEYDQFRNLILLFPESTITSGKFTVCDPSAMTCTVYAPATGPAPIQGSSSLRWDADDHNFYWLGGAATSIWSVNAGNPTAGWTNFNNATCTGADCVFTSGSIGHPPVRQGQGFAYSTQDHVWVIAGGVNLSNVALDDIWKFDPTAGSGAGAYTEVCGPGATSCGTFPTWPAASAGVGDRMVYNPDANVFMFQEYGTSAMWVYPLTAATANYGATTVSYGLPAATAPVIGSINRTVPQTAPSSGNTETGAFDLSVDAGGGGFYLSHVEPTVPTDSSGCYIPIPYIWSSTAAGGTLANGWLPTGTQNVACAAIQNVSFTQPSEHPYHARVGTTEYEVHGKRNWSGASTNNKAQIQTYSAGTWSGGDIGCATAACFSISSSLPQNTPRGIVNANGVPMVITLEMVGNFIPTQDVFVSNCSSIPCTSLTGTTPLNYTTGGGAYAGNAALAADPSGNMMACWLEEFNTSRTTMTPTPQLKCKYYNGTTWSAVGTGANSGSLNQALTNWARSPSVTFASGTWYVADTEQALTGVPKAYVQSCPINGTACSLLGAALNHNSTTGLAHQIKLTADGSTLLAAWTEQSATGQHNLGYLSKWTGSAWSAISSGFAADTINGSLIDIGTAVPTGGTAVVGWTEMKWGNLPQIYDESFSTGATCSITTASLPSGTVGTAYSTTVATSSCTSPSFAISGQPATLSIGTSTGTISGTPVSQKVYSVTVTVTDSNGCTSGCSMAYSLQITGPSLSVPLTVQETLFNGDMTGHTISTAGGIARTNEPVTVGVPLPDSVGIVDYSLLGLTGAGAAQFYTEETWPSGNIKWLKIRAIVPSLAAGGTTTLTLTNTGSGAFGGSNLATDNGTTITVSTNGGTCGAGSAICFTVKKANFDLLDQVQVGTSTIVSTGASAGIVAMGPSPTATFPGNVTCTPTSGGTACTTAYETANDASSTCTIEENGPSMAVLNCKADLNDGATHVYMHTTTRLYFYQGSAKMRAEVQLRNADYGTANTFAASYKGIQAFEARLALNASVMSGSLTYSIAAPTCTSSLCTGTVSSGNVAYLYQADSTNMQAGGDYCSQASGGHTAGSWYWCTPYTTLAGYAVMANGTAQATGTGAQYPTGWADISTAGGIGVEIGQYELAAYGNESLEFQNGGTDLRVGMWASENNTTSTSTTGGGAPYYMAYPEYSLHDIYFNFHTTTPASLPNEFLKMQHYLVARAPISWYNSSGVFYYPLADPTEESNFYGASMTAYTPVVSSSPVSPTNHQDLGTNNTNYWGLLAYKFYVWAAGGSGNQSDLRLSNLQNFLRRGFTGEYLNAAHFYKMISEIGLPRADGFTWSSHAAQTNYYSFPAVCDGSGFTPPSTCTNYGLGMHDWIPDDMEHGHMYGIIDYYLMSGDEAYRDLLPNYEDTFLNTGSNNNAIANHGGSYTSQRSAGVAMMGIARLANFANSTGDSTDATALLNQGAAAWQGWLKNSLCTESGGSGNPSCTANLNATTDSAAQNHGTSLDRGVPYIKGNYGIASYIGTCTFTGTGGQPRTFESIFAGPLLQGMWELRTEEGSGWSDYNKMFDYMQGIAQSIHGTTAIGGTTTSTNASPNGELFFDDGSNTWSPGGGVPNNGVSYIEWIDGASNCSSDWNTVLADAFWPMYWTEGEYYGTTQSTTILKRQVQMMVENLMFGCSPSSCAEIWHYTLARLIYLINHPFSYGLSTTTITGFTDNGGGSYTIQWTVPTNATSYRIKWGTRQIVDYIGYNAGTAAWVGNPATTQNWWASTDAASIPAPATPGTTQSMTIATGQTGLTSANFMVKTYQNSSSGPASTQPSSTSSGVTFGGARGLDQ